MENIKSFVITLERHTERQESFIKELNGLKYDIFMGIDGSKLERTPYLNSNIYLINYPPNNFQYLYDVTKQIKPDILNNNQLGCSLSHIELYKKLIQTNSPAYLIIEDDAQILVSMDKIKLYLDNLPDLDTFDVAMLCISDFFPYEPIYTINEFYCFPRRNFFSRTTAYIVTRRGANKLLMSNYPCVGLPADDCISNLFILDPGFTVIVPNKPLFVHDSFFPENNMTRPDIE